jgi:sugar/nucleoside kinase (ribokinase family)
MGLLDPDEDLSYGSRFSLRMAGAESNFAIALARLGVPSRWISRVGEDPIGTMIVDALAGEGVDVSRVRRDPGAPTGMYYKARAGGVTAVHYYRHGSAASRLAAGDVPDEALDGVALVHLTGITMALSPSAAGLVADVAARASARGMRVTFDLNWRPSLWEGPVAARRAYERVLPLADWVLCGAEEGAILFGGSTPGETIAALRDAGAGDAVVRVGARGAALLEAGREVIVPPEQLIDVVDEVGAGDAFAAGFVYALLQGAAPRIATATGNRLAAYALRGSGDWETLPGAEELEAPIPQES